jgi:hypothetical protein
VRLAAARLAVEGAVRAGPEHADRAAVSDHARVDFEDVRHKVTGLGVVGLVQAHGFRVVVDSDVNGPANRLLDAA